MSNTQVKPAALHKQCIKIASKYVKNHDTLQFELVDKGKGVFSLRNTNAPIVMEGRPRFYLLKVKNSKGLYIHISMTLKGPYIGASLESIYEFEGISIQFFHGTGKLFCRAEWDVKRKKDKLEHPQPHWHWGVESMDKGKSSFETVEDSVGNSSSFIDEITDVESSLPAVDFEELHYAMVAKWVTNDVAVEDFTTQRLCDWMKRCIGNVIDQYNYQVNKGSFVSSSLW